METCGHETVYGKREEYCFVEGADPEGCAAVVVGLAEDILYETERLSSEDMHLCSDSETGVQSYDRTFNYLCGDFESFAWPLHENTVKIRHESHKHLGRESYEIVTGWSIKQQGNGKDFYNTIYTIDVYPEGRVQTSIWEPNITGESQKGRRMVPYDYEKLFDELEIVSRLQGVEKADNARAKQAANENPATY